VTEHEEATEPGNTDDVDRAGDGEGLSTADYVRLTVFNRVSLLGVVLAVLGGLVVALTSPGGPFTGVDPLLGAGLLLLGVVVFAAGFSLGQRALGRREDW
jgi:drug/metabolite transporter (DMT)-like permease